MNRPLKRFGQNFLIDKNIILKILSAVKASKKDAVLEIGPGRGALSLELAKTAGKFCAVEVDRRFFSELTETLGDFKNSEVILGDILDFNLGDYALKAGVGKFKIFGNLPYYITTPILEYLFDNIQYVGDIFITVQKEVAQRMTARAGSKDYGSLSCFVSYFCDARILFKIKKGSFWPVPKVESAFVHLKPVRPADRGLLIKSESMFFDCLRKSFGQRRKRLLSSLSGLVKKDELSTLSCLDLLKKRPQELSLGDFAGVSNQIFDFLYKR